METELHGGDGGNNIERDGGHGKGAWPGERVYSSSVNAVDMHQNDADEQPALHDTESRKGFLALKDHDSQGFFLPHTRTSGRPAAEGFSPKLARAPWFRPPSLGLQSNKTLSPPAVSYPV